MVRSPVPVNPVRPDVPGVVVIVQGTEVGKPLKTTLPVGTTQVGCVGSADSGADGVTGCASMTTFAEAGELQSTSGYSYDC